MSKIDIIDSLEKKVGLLIDENIRLREEQRKLQTTRERLRSQNSELTARIGELERRITVLELREALSGETADRTGTRAARVRLNRLMREIDKCIALLNKDA